MTSIKLRINVEPIEIVWDEQRKQIEKVTEKAYIWRE